MNRLASRQSGYSAAANTNYFAPTGANMNVQIGGNVGVNGSATVTGIVVIVALALVLVGYHGLRV